MAGLKTETVKIDRTVEIDGQWHGPGARVQVDGETAKYLKENGLASVPPKKAPPKEEGGGKDPAPAKA